MTFRTKRLKHSRFDDQVEDFTETSFENAAARTSINLDWYVEALFLYFEAGLKSDARLPNVVTKKPFKLQLIRHRLPSGEKDFAF